MRPVCQTALTAVTLTSLLAFVAAAAADQGPAGATIRPFNGKNLEGWQCKGPQAKSHWTAGKAAMDPSQPRELIVNESQQGELVNAKAHGVDLYTTQMFGDCTIKLEFMVPQGSNSGVYVMGEYEIQILDSFGKEKIGPGDVGGLYGAAAPRVNAALPPGEWQKLEIVFRAPRFEGDRKTANARFEKIVLNGKTIHEHVEMQQHTPGGVSGKEAPAGPLMFQGNHGPVAYRNIEIIASAQR